jgi:hypothetical protein
MKREPGYILRNGQPMTEAQRRFAEERMEGIRKILYGEPKKREAEVVQMADYKERLERQINERRWAQGLQSLKDARAKRESMEHVQPEFGKPVSRYDHMKLFQNEIENEISKNEER